MQKHQVGCSSKAKKWYYKPQILTDDFDDARFLAERRYWYAKLISSQCFYMIATGYCLTPKWSRSGY